MDRHNWYFRFKPGTDWLQNHIGDIEAADRAIVVSLTDTRGVGDGFEVTERGAGQNFSVDVAAGVAFNNNGSRIFSDETVNVPFDTDIEDDDIEVVTPGNERIVSVYAQYTLVDDPLSATVDGNGNAVFTLTEEKTAFVLVQGTEAGAGLATPGAHPGSAYVLLAHVTIAQGDSTVADADIDTSVKELLTFFIAPDQVGEDEIDWGLSAGQVSAEDVPVRDTAGKFTGTNVETVLLELYTKLVPLGTILAFYPYSGAGVLTFSTDMFKYADGSSHDWGGSLGTQALPDLSNRILVGFGTEGGGDIDTASWDATPIGNANHQINLAHTHTVASHTHTVDPPSTSTSGSGSLVSGGPSTNTSGATSPGTDSQGSHSHTVNSHSHSAGGLYAQIAINQGFDGIVANHISVSSWSWDERDDGGSSKGSGSSSSQAAAVAGSTGSTAPGTSSAGTHSHTVDSHTHSLQSHTHTTSTHSHTVDIASFSSGAATPATDSQLSATTSILPRAVRVRFIVRVG